MTARKKIMIEGVERPYDEGEWLVWGPDGTLYGVMLPDARTGDDVAGAARDFFGGASAALARLNAGYRLELTTRERGKDILAKEWKR